MAKILGLDLGTNSVGWAIRDTDSVEANQIIDYGVLVYKKGVGDGKSGEFSLAAERRKNRSKRRLYNKNIRTPHTFVKRRLKFTVTETVHGHFSQWQTITIRYFAGQVGAIGS